MNVEWRGLQGKLKEETIISENILHHLKDRLDS